MRRTSTVCGLLLAAASLGTPSGVAACICEVVDESIVAWHERPVIFAGTVLTVEPPSLGAHPDRVLFVVDAVWRGPAQDTVTLVVEPSASCAAFTAGQQYLVTADLVEGSPIARTCSPSFLRRHAEELGHVSMLGPPSLERGPFGANHFDEGVTPIGAPAPVANDATWVGVGLGTDDAESLSRVLVADIVWTPDWQTGAIVEIPSGDYRLRIEWTDGGVVETYLAVRCEEQTPSGQCAAYRHITRR